MNAGLASYFRKVYSQGPIPRCPHIFAAKDNTCMKKRCQARRRWIKEFRQARWPGNSMSALVRNRHVLDAIEGIQFRKDVP